MLNRPYSVIYVWLLLFIMMFSCCSHPINKEPADHPQLTDTILNKAALLPEHKKIKFVDQAFSKFKPGTKDRIKRYGFFIGFYTNQRNYYKASDYADSMIVLTEPMVKLTKNYNESLAKAYFFKGDAQLALNNVDAAIKLYDKADELQTTISNLSTKHFDYDMRLASGFYQQGDFDLSIKYSKLALLDKSADSDPWIVFTLTQAIKDNIGLCFSRLNKADSALYYYDQALGYIKQNQKTFGSPNQKIFINVAKGIIYGNKAKVLASIGRKTAAERLWNLNIELTRNNLGEEDGEISRERLAELYLERHQPRRVVPMLDTIKTWADKPAYTEHKIRYLKLLAETSAQLGDLGKAHLINKQLMNLTDSVAKQKSASIRGNLEHLLAYNEKLSQVAGLQQEKKYTRLLLIGGALILLLSVLVGVLLWRNNGRSKHNVRQLKLLNEAIHIRNIELGKAFEALELSYAANSRMSQLVAHDLRSPIVAMRNFIQILNRATLPVKEKDNISNLIYTNCTDALSLIEDMLNNDTTRETLMVEQVELSGLIQHCITMLRAKADAKRQHIEFLPQSVIITGDEEKLRRVFDNLLTNAIKFTDTGGAIKILMRLTEADVIVSVADNGIGIPQDIQQKLFDISADIKRRGTLNEPSHGLGLFICRQIVEAHKGEIWFNTATGHGAVFNVLLHRHLA